VLTLEGHVKPVLTLDFCSDGYRLATAGEDHTARVWDLRAKRCAYTIAAHTSLVSVVRWGAPAARGGFLLTAGYDGLAKAWGGRDYRLLRALAGHEGKVMAAALGGPGGGRGGTVVATASYDRTIKLWRPDALLLGGNGDGGGGGGDDAEAMAI
jgi:U4/U6 small nuclear ribonucleoprotein PRP4